MDILETWAPPAALFVEVLLLVFAGRAAVQLLARRNAQLELTAKDNAAAGLALAGFLLGLFIALGGLIVGGGGEGTLDSPWPQLKRDALLVAMAGASAIAGLIVSASLWRPLLGIQFRRDLFETRNAAAGLVCGSAFAATGLVYHGALQGDGRLLTGLAFFGLGQGVLLATSLLHEWITAYDVHEEVVDKQNLAAAVSLAGALLATGIIVGHAATGDFVSWRVSLKGFLLHLVPILALPLVRIVVAGGILLGRTSLNREIAEDRNVAAALMEATAYVGTAICVTQLF